MYKGQCRTGDFFGATEIIFLEQECTGTWTRLDMNKDRYLWQKSGNKKRFYKIFKEELYVMFW